jgi:8-oxo-dGTP diphosphatase
MAYSNSMADITATGVTVTFTPVFDGQFMFVRRQLNDPVLGGYWGFPGGKVHAGETLASALVRELQEETGLQPTGRAFFVDSYLLGDRVGAHFAVEVTHNNVLLTELETHAWVKSVADLAQFTPRITGIDTHLHYITQRLDLLNKLAQDAPQNAELLHALGWQSLDEFDLVKKRFLNK